MKVKNKKQAHEIKNELCEVLLFSGLLPVHSLCALPTTTMA